MTNQLTLRKNMSSFVDEWIKFADVKEKSAVTYSKVLKVFFQYLSDERIVNPTPDDIYNWREFLKAQDKSPATVNLYLTAVKLFFKFLKVKGIYDLEISRMKGCKVSSEHKKDPLTAEQVKKILDSFDTKSIEGLRNKAIFALMVTCGLRTIEVSRADCSDLKKSCGRTMLFVQGKGRDEKSECVMIPEKVCQLINDFHKKLYCPKNGPLFPSLTTGGRLIAGSVGRIIKTSMRAAGIDSSRLTAHSLRHTAATAMLLNGVELAKVQQILRHKNINTTLIYSHHLERMKNHGEDAAADSFFN